MAGLSLRERVFSTQNAVSWSALLPARASVFGSLEYARIAEQHSGYTAGLYVITTEDSCLAYPFFLRPVQALPFATSDGEWFDTLSPEYTGPLNLTQIDASLATLFAERFPAFCRERGIIAEFAHLHPWHACLTGLQTTDVHIDREIVYVDLTSPVDQLWNESLTYACRKNIKRAHTENVRVLTATSADHIREFHRIYTHTMDRNRALGKYYFSLDYLLAFFEQMPNHARFVLAEYRDQIVAATLYLHDDVDVYSYLGGADQAFHYIRPTNAVVYDTIVWAQQHRKQRLILGGGYQPDDGIFRFKASFSPLRAQFQVYRHIHLPDTYDVLCQAWADYHHTAISANGYFPAYRSAPPPEKE